jgi:Asp-tRNA(Asn)/Glu-tRNA(Gln) amidotransferase A subunit family amidase
MLSFESLVIFTIFAIFLAFSFRNHEAITGKKIILGDLTYDIKKATAPKVDRTLLKIFSYIATETRFGPWIVRQLLNDNGVVNLRELSAQIVLPPLYFPMRKLNLKEQEQYNASINAHDRSVDEIIEKGTTSLGISHSSRPLGLRTTEEYAHFYRHDHVLPSEVIAKTLKTIRDWEQKGFRIFSEILEPEVMRQAYESDKRHREGKPLSILDGVPVAFKDMMDLEGHHHYNGQNPSEKFAAYWHIAETDDELVKRFRAKGAILLGMTIMTEGGVTPVGFNAHFQGPYSAYSWNRYSGGSSSGSAVAVATGLVPIAIGFDGGGSVRLPATMSGVHGLATTFGRCPFKHHISSTLIKAGPIAATASDTAIAYSVISANDPKHFYSRLYDGGIIGPPQPHVSRFNDVDDLSGVRIGIFTSWFNDSEPHIRDQAYKTIDFLKRRGVQMVEVSIPHLEAIRLAHGLKISSEFALGFDKHHHDVNSG